jgi:hypothetical protein
MNSSNLQSTATIDEVMERSGSSNLTREEFLTATSAGRHYVQQLRDRGEPIPHEALTLIDVTMALVAQVSRVADALEALTRHTTGR